MPVGSVAAAFIRTDQSEPGDCSGDHLPRVVGKKDGKSRRVDFVSGLTEAVVLNSPIGNPLASSVWLAHSNRPFFGDFNLCISSRRQPPQYADEVPGAG